MSSSEELPQLPNLHLARQGNVFIITLQKPPENRLDVAFCQNMIKTFHFIQKTLGPLSEGAVITRGNDAKFFCTGLDFDEQDVNEFANTDGFFPMLHTIVEFPFPTIALVTGHTFGGACPFMLSHDYRVMNSKRGFISMVCFPPTFIIGRSQLTRTKPPIDLGLHFDGIGSLLRLKLPPKVARKMLLEAHRWTGEEALADGIVDFIAPPDKMFDVAMNLAKKWASKAKMGVYGVLRSELYGEAEKKFQGISYVHSRATTRPALAKI
jgi:enoyl-CoA hydratase/carnithine racemase